MTPDQLIETYLDMWAINLIATFFLVLLWTCVENLMPFILKVFHGIIDIFSE